MIIQKATCDTYKVTTTTSNISGTTKKDIATNGEEILTDKIKERNDLILEVNGKDVSMVDYIGDFSINADADIEIVYANYPLGKKPKDLSGAWEYGYQYLTAGDSFDFSNDSDPTGTIKVRSIKVKCAKGTNIKLKVVYND